MFNGKMKTEPMPSRVFALYKAVQKHNGISREDLKNMIEPLLVEGKTAYFAEILATAIELDIVKNDDGHLKTTVSFKTIEDFRDYVINRIPQLKSSRFYITTRTLIGLDSDILKLPSISDQETLNIINQKNDDFGLNQTEIRGWRFWAQFIGFGAITEPNRKLVFLPNAYVYLKTVLRNSSLCINEEIPISVFLNTLDSYLDILDNRSDRDTFSMALSFALRELNEAKEISLIYHNDQIGNKLLYKSSSRFFNDPVSAVIIKEGLKNEQKRSRK